MVANDHRRQHTFPEATRQSEAPPETPPQVTTPTRFEAVEALRGAIERINAAHDGRMATGALEPSVSERIAAIESLFAVLETFRGLGIDAPSLSTLNGELFDIHTTGRPGGLLRGQPRPGRPRDPSSVLAFRGAVVAAIERLREDEPSLELQEAFKWASRVIRSAKATDRIGNAGAVTPRAIRKWFEESRGGMPDSLAHSVYRQVTAGLALPGASNDRASLEAGLRELVLKLPQKPT